MTNPIEDARAALAYPVQPGHLYEALNVTVHALTALIAEHERLQESARILGDLSTELSGDLQDATARLTPPSDDEREALARLLWEAEVEHNPEGVTPGVESWEDLCAEEPEWAAGYRHQAGRSLAAGFRRNVNNSLETDISVSTMSPSDDEREALVKCPTCNDWIEHHGDPEKTLFEHQDEAHS